MDLVSMAHENGAGDIGLAMPAISDYPYCLRMRLGKEELEKLGIKDLPPAGTEFHIEAMAVCTESATRDNDADGDVDSVCLELQITEMACEHDHEPEKGGKSKADRLYGGDEDDEE